MSDESASNTNALPIGEAAALLRAARRILLTTHLEPDPDGIGCEMALHTVLCGGDRTCHVLNPEPTPPTCAFLDPEACIRVHEPAAKTPVADLIVVLDTCTWSQLGTVAQVVRDRGDTPCLVIDHHATSDALGDVVLASPEAPCTGWLVLQVLDALDPAAITPQVAEHLFAALAFDTGWLRYNNAREPAYRMGARLVGLGAVPHHVFLAMEERRPAKIIRLTGLVLAGLDLACDGVLGVLTITREMLEATGTTPADVTNLVNQCYGVTGVHSALLFTEMPEGGVKVSLRSRGVVDVSALASRFGGGGHARAAGARIDLPLDQARDRVVTAFCEAIRAAS